jgi:hypothetical protein
MKKKIFLLLALGLVLVISTGQSWAAKARIINLEDLTADGSGHGKVSIHSWEPNRDTPGWSTSYLNIVIYGGELYSGTDGFNAIYVIFPRINKTYRVYNFSPGQNQMGYTERRVYLWNIPDKDLLFREDIIIEIRREFDDGLDSTDIAFRGSDSGDVQPPETPVGLYVESTTEDSVTLSWIDITTDEIGYRVERAPTSVGPFAMVATLGPDTETYTQTGLDAGRYYHYRVCAYNADGDSQYTGVALATTQVVPDEEGDLGFPIPAVADSLDYVELYSNDSNGYVTTGIEIDSGSWYWMGGIPDDEWGSWDYVTGYCVSTRNPYPVIDYRQCFQPGPDWDWFTGDDIVSRHILYIYDSEGNLVQRDAFYEPGPDATWGTSDDKMHRYELYSYDSNNRLIRYMRFNGAGSDGNWFTSDDTVFRTRRWYYDADGKVTMRVESRHPGIDGTWFTTDDITYNYRIPEFGSNEKAGRNIIYGKGNDGIWFTSDDEVIGTIIYIRDSNGYLLGEFWYDNPGTDGVWFQ